MGTDAYLSSLLLILSGPVVFDMPRTLRTLYTSVTDTTLINEMLTYEGRSGSGTLFLSSKVCETKSLLSKFAFSRSFDTIVFPYLRGPSGGETPLFKYIERNGPRLAPCGIPFLLWYT